MEPKTTQESVENTSQQSEEGRGKKKIPDASIAIFYAGVG